MEMDEITYKESNSIYDLEARVSHCDDVYCEVCRKNNPIIELTIMTENKKNENYPRYPVLKLCVCCIDLFSDIKNKISKEPNNGI